jgi:hypothetical protein
MYNVAVLHTPVCMSLHAHVRGRNAMIYDVYLQLIHDFHSILGILKSIHLMHAVLSLTHRRDDAKVLLILDTRTHAHSQHMCMLEFRPVCDMHFTRRGICTVFVTLFKSRLV